MNYEELKRNIADVVKPNGNQEITGQIMRDALFALIENLGEGWQFGGAVRPSDVPALGADVRGFWLAVEKGVYADFGDVEVTELSAIVYSDGWAVLPLGVPFGVDTEAEIGALSERVRALEADGSVTTSRIADGAVTTPKIANKAVSQEKLSKELQDNLAHKAVVYNFNVNNPDDIPQLVQAYKADANQSVFLVYRSGMYYPAILITQQYNEAIIFYQPEGTNLKKIIVRATGVKEVTIWGDTVRYGNQTLTDVQKAQARKNINLPDYETFDDITKLSSLTAKRLLYVGADDVNVAVPVSVNSSIEEIDFQCKKINLGGYDAEQIAFKGHPKCKLKNLSSVLTKVDYRKDANVCISKFGYVENVTVDCSVYDQTVGYEQNKTVGFLSCDHLYNCKVYGGGVHGESGIAKGYSYCNYLNLCRYNVSNELEDAKGFDHCNFISQCYVNRQLGETMGLGTNSNVESLIWILADGSFETFSNIDHITVGGYDTTNMFKTISSVGGTGKTKLYAKPDDKSGIATVLLDTAPVNWAVARRTPTGTLKVKDAVEDDDTVTKKQLDTLKTEVTQYLTEDEVANLWATTKS